MKKRVIFVSGPTAVGKTQAAACLAKKINAEIISCDSMQIYKGFDILSGKPARKELNCTPHHLIDIIPPTKEYNVSRFYKEAKSKVRDILARGKTPLFVGGTGLYMSILIEGIFKQVKVDKNIRLSLWKKAEKYGSDYLHERLKKIDPQAADKIHPNDTKRIVRALEVFEATGKPISLLQQERSGLAKEYNLKIFALDINRQKLYDRINQRVDKMFKQGLVGEIRRLLKLKLSKTASYAIGLRELKDYFQGLCNLGETKEKIKRNTRQYAKRQTTWFKKDKRITWIRVGNHDAPGEIAGKIWKKLY